jgi:hypothetical protein
MVVVLGFNPIYPCGQSTENNRAFHRRSNWRRQNHSFSCSGHRIKVRPAVGRAGVPAGRRARLMRVRDEKLEEIEDERNGNR